MNGFVDIPNVKKRCPFVFQDGELTVFSTNSIPLTDNALSFVNELSCNTKYITGIDISTNKKIVFFVYKIPFSDKNGMLWTSTTTRVYFYIVMQSNDNKLLVNEIAFSFPELNYFFNLQKGILQEFDLESEMYKTETVPYNKTKKNFNFEVDKISVEGEFGIKQTINTGSEIPLKLSSILSMHFEQTSDIDFILNLNNTVKRLFCFLCYRKNIHIDSIKIYGTNDENYKRQIGELYILNTHSSDIEDEEEITKTINYELIEQHFSTLIQNIADGNLYFNHLPKSKSDSRTITVARTILVTAAFEWTFKQVYGDLQLSDSRQQVKDDIITCLKNLSDNKSYNSKQRNEIKHYQKIVSNVDRSLSEKILFALKDCDAILSPFITKIFSFNKQKVDAYTKIAEELEYQRNVYAHGSIDKKMKDNIIFDVIILEWLNYCMVFKSMNYSDEEIFNIINKIFDRNFVNINTKGSDTK